MHGHRGILLVRILAVIMAMNLGWFTCTTAQLQTPYGKQCPTAYIQSVSTPIYNCCHKLVGYATRDVKPGDKGFLQCRCAEKTDIQLKLALNPAVDLFLPAAALEPNFGHAILIRSPFDSRETHPLGPVREPFVPPPTLA